MKGGTAISLQLALLPGQRRAVKSRADFSDSDNLCGPSAYLPEGPRGKFVAGARSSAG